MVVFHQPLRNKTLKTISYKLKLSEPGRNKCSACARLKKDYFEKRAKQHEVILAWLNERFGEEVSVVRSDGKTGVIVIVAKEGLKTQLESAPDVIEVL
jgi:thioredoxin-related protein